MTRPHSDRSQGDEMANTKKYTYKELEQLIARRIHAKEIEIQKVETDIWQLKIQREGALAYIRGLKDRANDESDQQIEDAAELPEQFGHFSDDQCYRDD